MIDITDKTLEPIYRHDDDNMVDLIRVINDTKALTEKILEKMEAEEYGEEPIR